ncbi:MAG: hypothetical protein RMJ88_16760 [Thermogemmata sp.]|nr:hypothetical protein [Thermogemmata sp.]
MPWGSIFLYYSDGQMVRGQIDQDGYYQIDQAPYGMARVAIRTPRVLYQGLRIMQKLPPIRDGPLTPEYLPADASRQISLPNRYAFPDDSGLSLFIDQKSIQRDFDLTPETVTN